MNANTLYIIRVRGPTHFYDSSMTLFKHSKVWEDIIASNNAQMAYFKKKLVFSSFTTVVWNSVKHCNR